MGHDVIYDGIRFPDLVQPAGHWIPDVYDFCFKTKIFDVSPRPRRWAQNQNSIYFYFSTPHRVSRRVGNVLYANTSLTSPVYIYITFIARAHSKGSLDVQSSLIGRFGVPTRRHHINGGKFSGLTFHATCIATDYDPFTPAKKLFTLV